MKRMNLDSGSDFIAFLQTSSNSLWVPSSSSPSFHETMVKFNQEGLQGGEEEMEKKAFEQQEKKRRLSPHQVHFLEKNFEVENKLEPERKVQLSIELGLQPRQVAIWFQNRRARFKTKQLEKDYGSLKASYDRLKANFDTLIKDRDDLQIQAKLLMKKLKERDMGRENSDPNNPKPEEVTKIEVENMGKMGEDVSSAKSGVFDSESPHYYTEPAMDLTGMADPDRPSDSPLYDDDMDKKSLVLPPTLAPLFSNSSLVDKSYDTNLTSSFSPVDDPSVWSWLC